MNDLEEQLAKAATEDLARTFPRFAEFLGAGSQDWFEFQALEVPTSRGKLTRFAHGRGSGAWRSLLGQADAWGAVGVYVVANRIDDAVVTRAPPGQWHTAQKGHSTSDRDITARRVVLFDVDRERASGTSATDAEVSETVPIALALHARLADVLGDAEALGYAHSGNGRQVLLALDDLPEWAKVAALVKRLVEAVSAEFSHGAVKIDTSVVDAKRLMPAFGTMKRKGAGVPGRPHRRTAFVCHPLPRRLSREELEDLVAMLAPEPGAPPATARATPRGHRAAFAKANDTPIQDVVAWLGLDGGGEVRCPGCGHTSGVKLVGNGLKCHHATCAKKGVPNRPGFRTAVDLVCEVKALPAKDAARALEERFHGRDPHEETRDLLARWDAPNALPRTDTGNGERLVRMFGEDIRFCSHWNTWLIWNGNRWDMDDGEKRLLGMTKDVARAIPLEGVGTSEAAEYDKFALESESAAARMNMIRMAAGETGVRVAYARINAAHMLFSCANGTINLATGEHVQARRGDLFTIGSTVAFDREATCPTWLAFLDRIFAGDAQLIAFLQRVCGYCMTGLVEEKGLFILHGNGANGKSTFTRIVQHVLGQFAVQMPRTALLERQNEPHPTELTRLFRARLAICQEIEANKHLSEAQLKSLTGNDIVTARRMHEDFWEFHPTHKFFLATNHKPNIRGVDEGIWRRICLIPFEVTIPEDERDPALLDKLMAEAAGILNWTLGGTLAWRRSGLRAPAKVLAATAEYRGEEDVTKQFIEDQCVVAPCFSVGARQLFQAFNVWCEEGSQRACSQTMFGIRLRTKGFEPVRGGKGVRRWRGLRLKEECEHVHDAAERRYEADEREAIAADGRERKR